MSIIVGIFTIVLTAYLVRLLGAHEENVGCYTILILLFGLPMISNIGEFIMSLF